MHLLVEIAHNFMFGILSGDEALPTQVVVPRAELLSVKDDTGSLQILQIAREVVDLGVELSIGSENKGLRIHLKISGVRNPSRHLDRHIQKIFKSNLCHLVLSHLLLHQRQLNLW